MCAARRDAAPVSAREASDAFAWLANEPALVLAVSGGPDSTALLWLLGKWRKSLKKGPRLVAVTVDHALRPEAKAEARAVAALARSLGVEHRVLRWRGEKPSTGLQAAARAARYSLLADAARRARAACIVTAHTLDDQAETVLMRLAAGSGLGGLAGMRKAGPAPGMDAAGVYLARPLLGFAKARLVETLAAAGVSHADDPTNRDPRFARARLRASMDVLAREGLTAERLIRLADRVARAEGALFDVTTVAQRRLLPMPQPANGPFLLDAAAFASLPAEIGLRLLSRAVAWSGNEGPVELGKLESLHEALADALASEARGRLRRTLAGAMVTLAGSAIRIERAPARRSRAAVGRTRQR